MADMDLQDLTATTVASGTLAWTLPVTMTIGVAMIVELKSGQLLDTMDETMRHGIYEMSVRRCHHPVAETAVMSQEPVPQPVHVVVATKPQQRHPGHHERCSSLHLDRGHRIPTMED
jgi:hypothetical protein